MARSGVVAGAAVAGNMVGAAPVMGGGAAVVDVLASGPAAAVFDIGAAGVGFLDVEGEDVAGAAGGGFVEVRDRGGGATAGPALCPGVLGPGGAARLTTADVSAGAGDTSSRLLATGARAAGGAGIAPRAGSTIDGSAGGPLTRRGNPGSGTCAAGRGTSDVGGEVGGALGGAVVSIVGSEGALGDIGALASAGALGDIGAPDDMAALGDAGALGGVAGAVGTWDVAAVELTAATASSAAPSGALSGWGAPAASAFSSAAPAPSPLKSFVKNPIVLFDLRSREQTRSRASTLANQQTSAMYVIGDLVNPSPSRP